jgi:hypothetical protein
MQQCAQMSPTRRSRCPRAMLPPISESPVDSASLASVARWLRADGGTDARRGSEGESALRTGSTMRRALSFPSLSSDVQDENSGRPRAARHQHETRQYNLKRLLAASCAQHREQALKANHEGALSSAQGDATAWKRCDSESTLSSAASIVIDTPKFGVVSAPTSLCLQAAPNEAPGERIAGGDQTPDAHDTPAFERTDSSLLSDHTPNAHDAPDWDHRTCKRTSTTVDTAVLGEQVEAGVRARMCPSTDSLATDKSLAVVANFERSAGPHYNDRLVLPRGDRSGCIIHWLQHLDDLIADVPRLQEFRPT